MQYFASVKKFFLILAASSIALSCTKYRIQNKLPQNVKITIYSTRISDSSSYDRYFNRFTSWDTTFLPIANLVQENNDGALKYSFDLLNQKTLKLNLKIHDEILYNDTLNGRKLIQMLVYLKPDNLLDTIYLKNTGTIIKNKFKKNWRLSWSPPFVIQSYDYAMR